MPISIFKGSPRYRRYRDRIRSGRMLAAGTATVHDSADVVDVEGDHKSKAHGHSVTAKPAVTSDSSSELPAFQGQTDVTNPATERDDVDESELSGGRSTAEIKETEEPLATEHNLATTTVLVTSGPDAKASTANHVVDVETPAQVDNLTAPSPATSSRNGDSSASFRRGVEQQISDTPSTGHAASLAAESEVTSRVSIRQRPTIAFLLNDFADDVQAATQQPASHGARTGLTEQSTTAEEPKGRKSKRSLVTPAIGGKAPRKSTRILERQAKKATESQEDKENRTMRPMPGTLSSASAAPRPPLSGRSSAPQLADGAAIAEETGAAPESGSGIKDKHPSLPDIRASNAAKKAGAKRARRAPKAAANGPQAKRARRK